jgi:phage terminase large subunit-like protein
MCLATEEGQATLVYSTVHLNLTEGPLASTPGVDAGRTRVFLPGGGVIRAGSAGAASKDGLLPTLLVADETHLMTLRELKELHAVAWRGIFKRPDALLVETTTAFRPGQGSVAEVAYETYRRLTPAESDRTGVLYDHRGATCTLDDLDDPVKRMAALIEAYGEAAAYMALEDLSAAWDLPDVDTVDWARYWANMVVASADNFMDPAVWASRSDAATSLHDGDMVCLGLDSSLVDDGTAVVAARVGDGHVQRLGYWQKPDGRAGVGWTVPYGEVDGCVRAAFDRFDVKRLYADPQYIHSHLDQWSVDFGSRRVYSWPTNRAIPMSAALQRFYVAAVSGSGISHDGDALLAQHVGSARTWMSQGRTLVRKESKHSARKIDLLVAAVLAFEARGDVIAAGEDAAPQAKSRRAWSFS